METKGLTKEEKARAKDKMKELALKESNVSPEDAKKVQEMFELAQMPIVLKDKDIKLGKGEVDFRKLSEENKTQMLFRYFTLNNIYLKDIRESLVDIQKLLMIMLKNQGVEDIIKATDEIVEQLAKELKNKMN